VIRSFRSRALRQFAATGDASKLSVPNYARVRQILLALNAATAPQAMNVPGLKFHALKGREKGRYAVWASGNYRITFGWDGKDAINLDLEDYH
jgi:proteic killer suppression protein